MVDIFPASLKNVDPYIAAAMGLVLMGIASLSKPLYAMCTLKRNEERYKDSSDLERVSYMLNGLEVFSLIAPLQEAKRYLEAANNLVPGGNQGRPKEISPIALTIGLVEGYQQLTGFGPPYRGDDLESDSSAILLLSDQLMSSYPNNNFWQSDAANYYIQSINNISRTTEIIEDIDSDLRTLAHQISSCVTESRISFSVLMSLLLVAWGITQICTDEASRWWFELNVALTGGVAANGLVVAFAKIMTDPLKDRANNLAKKYDQVAATGTPANFATANKSIKQQDLHAVHTIDGGFFSAEKLKSITATHATAKPVKLLTKPILNTVASAQKTVPSNSVKSSRKQQSVGRVDRPTESPQNPAFGAQQGSIPHAPVPAEITVRPQTQLSALRVASH